MQLSIEQLIREHTSLGKLSATGFHSLKCPICHDHSERMGIKFGGDEVGVNCFNCGFGARYTENSGEMSKKFKTLLEALLVPMDEVDRLLGKAFFNRSEENEVITLESIKKKSQHLRPVDLPTGSFLLGTPGEHQELQDAAYKYLNDRKLRDYPGPIYLSTDPHYANRVIVPFFKSGKLIYWQARTIVNENPRYLNCDVSKDMIIYGYDELQTWSKMPLWVVEGIFDAMSIGGIALIGSKISENKIDILRKAKRDLIFVIDQDDNGLKLGKKVLEEGWKITFTERDSDVNKSVQLYGKLWTIYSLAKNIPKSRFDAETQLNLRCRKKTQQITKK